MVESWVETDDRAVTPTRLKTERPEQNSEHGLETDASFGVPRSSHDPYRILGLSHVHVTKRDPRAMSFLISFDERLPLVLTNLN